MENTGIQWADSTLNLQMGCEGCELVKGRVLPACYAKTLTDRYANRKGWPEAFEIPKIFLERLPLIAKWKDLTGTKRPGKEWLNGLPRVIFLNDMGDTFTKGLNDDWFADCLPTIEASPHIFMLLTKWPKRMAKFSQKFPLPKNIWCGTSVTSEKTAFRAYELNEEIVGGGLRWLSIEPMWGQIQWKPFKMSKIELMIFGGESGSTNVTPFNCNWLKYQIEFCNYANKHCFVKQLGSNPIWNGKPLNLNDYHGGDSLEWPEVLRVREYPKIEN